MEGVENAEHPDDNCLVCGILTCQFRCSTYTKYTVYVSSSAFIASQQSKLRRKEGHTIAKEDIV